MPSWGTDRVARLRARAERAIGDKFAEEVMTAFDEGPDWSGELELGLVRAAIRVSERATEEAQAAARPRIDPDTGALVITGVFKRFEDRAQKTAKAVATAKLPKELAQAFGLRVNLPEVWREVAAEDMMPTLQEEASADPRSEPFKVRLLRAAQRNAMRLQDQMREAQRPESPIASVPATFRASVAIEMALGLEDEVLGQRPGGRLARHSERVRKLGAKAAQEAETVAKHLSSSAEAWEKLADPPVLADLVGEALRKVAGEQAGRPWEEAIAKAQSTPRRFIEAGSEVFAAAADDARAASEAKMNEARVARDASGLLALAATAKRGEAAMASVESELEEVTNKAAEEMKLLGQTTDLVEKTCETLFELALEWWAGRAS